MPTVASLFSKLLGVKMETFSAHTTASIENETKPPQASFLATLADVKTETNATASTEEDTIKTTPAKPKARCSAKAKSAASPPHQHDEPPPPPLPEAAPSTPAPPAEATPATTPSEQKKDTTAKKKKAPNKVPSTSSQSGSARGSAALPDTVLASGDLEGGPASPESGVGTSPTGSREIGAFYKLTAAERSTLLSARTSKDVDLKLRNKIYVAMNRFLKSEKVTKAAIDNWAAASAKGDTGKFEFLQKWARDTSGGKISLHENHQQSTEDSENTTWVWTTKWDLYNAKKAFKNPEMRLYCDKILSSAKTKKHADPKFKNDTDMKLYRVLGEVLDQQTISTKRTSTMKLSADVDKDAHASVLDQFSTSKPKADEEDEERTPAKKLKASVQDQRTHKMKEDLKAAETILSGIDNASEVQREYLTPMKNALLANTDKLNKFSHGLHDMVLHGQSDADVEREWALASLECRSLKQTVEMARSVLQPGSFTPHTTQWDSCLA